MKKTILLSAALILSATVWAQVPQGITHQAVIRNAANELLANQTIGIQVSILQGSAEGTAVFVETHSPTSNANGLITYVIGQGINVSGTFAQIDWADGLYFLKTEADPTGGSNYTITGTMQFLSVPYALIAEKVAGSISSNILPPKVMALEATEITFFSATLNGIVNGEGFLTEVVFEWGETTEYGYTVTAIQSPVTGSMDVEISTELDELTVGTQYHFRVRASNAVNVTNSDNMWFSAMGNPLQVSTNPATNILNYTAIGGGEVTSDGGLPIIARGVVWSTSENPTIENNEGMTNDGDSLGQFTSYLTGLNPGTNYYVRAYATNILGTAYGNVESFSTNACPSSVTFTYNGATVTYGVVESAGKCWLDRNLGATQVATSSTDANSYGHLYQWGRGADGHQIRTSGTTNTLSSGDTPGHGDFIVATDSPYDWRSTQNNNLWQGMNGVNNPCPTGYRLPTEAELNAERLSWSSNNSAGAFASPLKLPVAGSRGYSGSFGPVNSYGSYWSSTVAGTDSQVLSIVSDYAGMGSGRRASGLSVRCLKD